MNNEQRTIRGFTLIELLVAISILAVALSIAGVIFRVSIESHRAASANAEVMQKLRAITDQLDADLTGLRKDGEIFIVWAAARRKLSAPLPNPNDPNAFERFDRIMFFADGDFQSYRASPLVRGNLARVCYTLAKKGSLKVHQQPPEKRILARTQHILIADLPPFDPNGFGDQQWYDWNNLYEYDKIFLDAWKNIPLKDKIEMLSVIGDVAVRVSTPGGTFTSKVKEEFRGANVNPKNPNSIHMLLCQGVGEFKVQSWYDDQRRWIPEVNPDGDRDLDDSDFLLLGNDLDPNDVPVLWYPYGAVSIRNINYPAQAMDEDHFYSIPGLGRALKFTFTLYDSKGIIKTGRTFTHIVYLE
jgi:prepilin-type N-terminal cleavage/methylation domain-containing protein